MKSMLIELFAFRDEVILMFKHYNFGALIAFTIIKESYLYMQLVSNIIHVMFLKPTRSI
jgi:hypothetical protein